MTRPINPPCPPRGPRSEPSGPIRAGESYPVKLFLRLAGWKKGALATAKRQGLPVRRAGGRSYVLGSDWIAFLSRDEGSAP